MERRFRRVVTVDGADGSEILFDDLVAPLLAPVPGMAMIDIWNSRLDAEDLGHRDETIGDKYQLPDSPGQIMFKMVVWPPAEVFREHGGMAQYFADETGTPYGESDDPAIFMHRSLTTDYIVILDGEITCLLETGETTLRAGDVMVQRGTNHGWINRGEKNCVIACVMVAANPLIDGR